MLESPTPTIFDVMTNEMFALLKSKMKRKIKKLGV